MTSKELFSDINTNPQIFLLVVLSNEYCYGFKSSSKPIILGLGLLSNVYGQEHVQVYKTIYSEWSRNHQCQKTKGVGFGGAQKNLNDKQSIKFDTCKHTILGKNIIMLYSDYKLPRVHEIHIIRKTE